MKFKKFNLVIGKRQIVIASLLVTLSVAAFLNWQFATGDQAITVMDVSEKTKKNEEENHSSNYGEAELVNKKTDKKIGSVEKNDYFKKEKIVRDSSYDDAIDNTNSILKNNNLSQDDRSKVLDQSLQLSEKKTQQEAIESQVKAKNLADDCVSYGNGNRVNIYVKTGNLTDEKVAQIKDIVIGVTDTSASNIVITPYQQK